MSIVKYLIHIMKFKSRKLAISLELRSQYFLCSILRMFNIKRYIEFNYYKQLIIGKLRITKDNKTSTDTKVKDILEELKSYSNLEDIDNIIKENFEKDDDSKIIIYYKLALFFKDQINFSYSKECFLKTFDIYKKNNINYHYSKIEILRDYCKLLLNMGEINSADLNYTYFIQHAFIFQGKWSEETVNYLLELAEFKIWSDQSDAALANIEYANSIANQIRFFKRSVNNRNMQFKVKSNLGLTYLYVGSYLKFRYVMKQLDKLNKQLKINEVKEILTIFTGKETEETLKEIDDMLSYSLIRARYLECMGNSKEALAILEKSAVISRKNIKRFYKKLIEINQSLISIHFRSKMNENKYNQLYDEIIKAFQYYQENSVDKAINLMNFSDSLLRVNHLEDAYQIIIAAEKILKFIYQKNDDNIYYARIFYLFGSYYSKKNDFSKGENFLMKALDIFQKFLGDNEYSNMVKFEMVDMFIKKEKTEKSKEKTNDESHKNIVRIVLDEDNKENHGKTKKAVDK